MERVCTPAAHAQWRCLHGHMGACAHVHQGAWHVAPCMRRRTHLNGA
eukprot:CAMPEP_0202893436 /NCGR_PEP_ID=MMETSP1392-20130828/3026_1 /ASSEMBLY_ACC=CAM_ASM_000868 /TAXON_ID=225041 /ORGANISM="Chlamydomonas chlamydogama, Strain SAG 11-48b" /LENGTH=46 /DNA_ID= /DNA_START= /DNA_END= /DNA_ORIENTATION=